MSIDDVPALLILIGLAAYAVLAGADFGAGFWQVFGGRGAAGREMREHAHHAMGPVWEANHVWLIFVLVVCWTAYPTAFASIMSTLTIPLFIAAVGIIFRGSAYALRSGTATAHEQRLVDLAFAGSSILTPFALGTVIGGIVSGRVPVGNAAGHRFSSWLGPTSVALGVLFVATAAYLAAVYLAADASRLRRTDLERRFQVRGLAMAVVAGAAAVAGLVAVHHDARSIWDGLTSGAGLGAVIASAVAGVATVTLLLRQRYAWARISAATAVAAIVAGWGAAQHPTLLPGLTVHQGAAEHSVLVALILVLALGAFVLIPSLVLLFSLVLHGRFDTEREATNHVDRGSSRVRLSRLLVPAIACLAVGTVTTVIPDAAWGRIVGIPLLLAFVGFGFVALAETITTSSD